MKVARLLKHLWYGNLHARTRFPAKALEDIAKAIAASEARHGGEIRFAVEPSLDLLPLLKGLSARDRAVQVFSSLGIWDTEANNGVLVYLLLADRDVEIVGDRGIHAKVGAAGWETICHGMESAFRQGRFREGVLGGIEAIGRHLEKHFPRAGTGPADRNELSDKPVLL